VEEEKKKGVGIMARFVEAGEDATQDGAQEFAFGQSSRARKLAYVVWMHNRKRRRGGEENCESVCKMVVACYSPFRRVGNRLGLAGCTSRHRREKLHTHHNIEIVGVSKIKSKSQTSPHR
jgi:hypothetical protein